MNSETTSQATEPIAAPAERPMRDCTYSELLEAMKAAGWSEASIATFRKHGPPSGYIGVGIERLRVVATLKQEGTRQ